MIIIINQPKKRPTVLSKHYYKKTKDRPTVLSKYYKKKKNERQRIIKTTGFFRRVDCFTALGPRTQEKYAVNRFNIF